MFSYSEAAEAENTVSVVCDCEGMKHLHTEIHSHSDTQCRIHIKIIFLPLNI